MSIYEQIIELIAHKLKRQPDEIAPDADLVETLGADSLDVVEILIAIEDRFGLYIPDSKVIEMHSAAELVAYVEENS